MAAPPEFAQDKDGYFASGRVLVMTKPGLPEGKFSALIAKHAAKTDRSIKGVDGIEIKVVKVPPGLEKKIADELKTDTNIEFAELDRLVKADFIPNDSMFGSQWHHTKIGSAAAWDVATANNVVVAILDTGVNSQHEDLAAIMLPGWNVVSQNADTSDVTGHGTAVAGTVAAIFNNTIGVAGVASGAKILPVRITNETTSYATWSSVASGVIWAADNGAKIVNNSYASYAGSSVISAANYLKSKGGIMFASAGNDNAVCTVAADPSIMVVSATDSNDAKASWSNYGDCIDISAPGVGIITTSSTGGYKNANGTSFASPISASVAALIYSANPALSPNDIESIMKTTAFDPAGTDFSTSFGYGRVDALKAVQLAKTYTPTINDTTLPTASITSPTNGSVVKGLVTVNANASDNIGVTKVDLRVNGVFYATDAVAPYSFAWDTAALGNASAALSVVASDAAGNTRTSSVVNVNVNNVADTIAPTITLATPTNGTIVSGNVTIKATATDNVAIASMSITVDGKQIATSTTGSVSGNWNTRKVAAGAHTIVIKATDSSANTSQVSITVNTK